MHEMGIVRGMLKIVLETGEKSEAQRIRKIRIHLGELSDVVPEILTEYFHVAAEGTMAEQARLEIHKVPAMVSCRGCGKTGPVGKGIVCSYCGGMDISLVSGRECYIENIEVE